MKNEGSIVTGQRIRMLRKERGLSMDDLTNALNKISKSTISKSTISMWETGNREPMLSSIKLLANFFSVSPAFLIGMSDDRNEKVKEPEIPDDEYLAAMNRAFTKLSLSGRVKLLAFAFDLLDEEGKA